MAGTPPSWIAFVAALCAAQAMCLGYVNSRVPEAYMDEIFHHPQTQRYCLGRYSEWDDKITTLPGLYVFGTAWAAGARLLLGGTETEWCSVTVLRGVNGAYGVATAVVVLLVLQELHPRAGSGAVAARAAAMSLFPVHFFFTTLYYTDVGSVFFVMWAYYLGLRRRPWAAAAAGAVSILFRQSNVVWCGFMAGASALNMVGTPAKAGLAQVASTLAAVWTERGRLLRYHAPYLGLGAAFAVFVLVNDGVVVGDRAAHVAVQHFPQALYGSVFVAAALGPAHWLTGRGTSVPAFFGALATSVRTVAAAVVLSALSYGAVKYYTFAHPYLLADNRHFTFYIWQRFFRRPDEVMPGFPQLYIPLYVYAAWSIDRALAPAHPQLLWRAGLYVCACAVLVPAGLLELRYFTLPLYFVALHVPMRTAHWGDRLNAVFYGAASAAVVLLFAGHTFPYGGVAGAGRFMF